MEDNNGKNEKKNVSVVYIYFVFKFDYVGGKHPPASSSFSGYRTREKKKETDLRGFECGT